VWFTLAFLVQKHKTLKTRRSIGDVYETQDDYVMALAGISHARPIFFLRNYLRVCPNAFLSFYSHRKFLCDGDSAALIICSPCYASRRKVC